MNICLKIEILILCPIYALLFLGKYYSGNVNKKDFLFLVL